MFGFRDYVVMREDTQRMAGVYSYIAKLSRNIASQGTNDDYIANPQVRQFFDKVLFMLLRDLLPKLQSMKDMDEKVLELENYKKVVQQEWDRIGSSEEMDNVDRILGMIWDMIAKAL